MKLILVILLLAVISACGNGKTIGGVYYECYGFFDKEEVRNDKIQYSFVTMNLVPGIIFAETILVPVFLFGTQSYCPMGFKSL